MNTERLKHLITILAAVPPEKLVMEVWSSPHHWCGAAACAFGWAAQDPVFNKQGLTLVKPANSWAMPTYYSKQVIHAEGFGAAVWFFGISYDQAYHLFDPDLYVDDVGDNIEDITPAMVIARINKLLEQECAT